MYVSVKNVNFAYDKELILHDISNGLDPAQTYKLKNTLAREIVMQEYMKLLCVNKIRESKRLIKNMFLPIVSMLIVAGFAGYQMMINIFLVIWRKNAFHARICYLVAGILILYSFYVCFINRKPEIVIKPASLFFIEMRKIRHA